MSRKNEITLYIPQSIAIRAGLPEYGKLEVVPRWDLLSPEDREEIATMGTETCIEVKDPGELVDWHTDHAPALLAILAREARALREKRAEQARAHQDLVAAIRAIWAECAPEYLREKGWSKLLSREVQGIRSESEMERILRDEVFPHEELGSRVLSTYAAYQALVEAEKAREIEEREANRLRYAEQQAAVAALKAAGLEALRAWAQAEGSPRLRLMLEMEVGDWESVAEEEFFLAVAPEGFDHATYQLGDDSPRKKPTLEELEALRRLQWLVRQANDIYGREVLSARGLYWHKVDPRDHDDDRPPEAFAALHVMLMAPNGSRRIVAKRLVPGEAAP